MCSSVFTRSHDVMSASMEFLSLRQVRCSAAGAPASKPGRSRSPNSAQRVHEVRPGIMRTNILLLNKQASETFRGAGYRFEMRPESGCGGLCACDALLAFATNRPRLWQRLADFKRATRSFTPR